MNRRIETVQLAINQHVRIECPLCLKLHIQSVKLRILKSPIGVCPGISRAIRLPRQQCIHGRLCPGSLLSSLVTDLGCLATTWTGQDCRPVLFRLCHSAWLIMSVEDMVGSIPLSSRNLMRIAGRIGATLRIQSEKTIRLVLATRHLGGAQGV